MREMNCKFEWRLVMKGLLKNFFRMTVLLVSSMSFYVPAKSAQSKSPNAKLIQDFKNSVSKVKEDYEKTKSELQKINMRIKQLNTDIDQQFITPIDKRQAEEDLQSYVNSNRERFNILKKNYDKIKKLTEEANKDYKNILKKQLSDKEKFDLSLEKHKIDDLMKLSEKTNENFKRLENIEKAMKKYPNNPGKFAQLWDKAVEAVRSLRDSIAETVKSWIGNSV